MTAESLHLKPPEPKRYLDHDEDNAVQVHPSAIKGGEHNKTETNVSKFICTI